ncbi:CBS domain-containing protein [Rhodobacter sp. NSM]|uniref:CBS domain-containing protein n=1 Tax=Rhodobacter sp. NSM TaxID=3457501 RepID=UPI003FD1AD41
MLVQQILKTKSDDGVVTVPPGSSISQAAEVLSSRRIGAVVVSRDGKRPDGMLSERDIVRELGRRGAGCLSDSIESIMTSKIATCVCTDEADMILEIMTEGRFRHLPVMAEGEMVGLISIGDVVKARLSELSMEKDALEGMIKGF